MCFSLHAEPGDYTMVSMDLVFDMANMNAMLCVDIPITDDLLCEGTETFSASLTAGQNAGLTTPSQATVTITDNDGTYSRMSNPQW